MALSTGVVAYRAACVVAYRAEPTTDGAENKADSADFVGVGFGVSMP